VKKFRTKKLVKNSADVSAMSLELINSKLLFIDRYK